VGRKPPLRYSLGMSENVNMVTAFRSADSSAEEEAEDILALLRETGIEAQLLDDRSPGVPTGVFEVRVPETDLARAMAAIHADQAQPAAAGDASASLDMATVFRSDAHNAEMEAAAVRGVLDASGIPSIVVGSPYLPNLPVEVRVPHAKLLEAQRVIEESQMAGPAAAEEAAGAAGTDS